MSIIKPTRVQLLKKIELMLGAQMVDVELDIEHYNLALDTAIMKLRQRSDGAQVEKDIFLNVTKEVSEYTLPAEVQEVRRLYRRGVGAYTHGGINFDPVDAAVYNIYLLQPNRSGGLATWDMYNQYLETTERVFASQYNFTWDVTQHKLTLIKKPSADEQVVVRVYAQKSDDDLINDPYTGMWLFSYATAMAKYILGEARDKFPSGFPGPNGAVTMNGQTLKTEAAADMEKLETQLTQQVTSSDGYGFIIG